MSTPSHIVKEPEDVKKMLGDLGIPFDFHSHAASATVPELVEHLGAVGVDAADPNLFLGKNLFVRSRNKKRHWLLTTRYRVGDMYIRIYRIYLYSCSYSYL